MALTPEQKSSRLFKKSLGAGETLLTRAYFEEPKLGNNNILPAQIWSEADSIPTTAPTLSGGESQGVIKFYEKLELTHIPGSQNLAYSDDDLKDAIPFNYDPAASYWYTLYKNDGISIIYDGDGDWLVDTSAGVLTFYGSLPSGVSDVAPPKISFYQYIGDKGLVQSGATSGINVKDPVIAATSGQTDATYSNALSGFTNLPSEVDGITSFGEDDRFLIKDQTIELQNGIFEVSGDTLVRAYDHDGTPVGEVGVNDYCFVLSGDTNIANAYVLGSTDAFNPNKIYPGVDSQTWKLFSTGLAYTADEQALKLDGTTFSVDLDGTGGSSGLYQSNEGLRLDSTITNEIDANTSGVTSLDIALSGETELRISGDISLETKIDNNVVVQPGEVWESQTGSGEFTWTDVAYNNGLFVTVGLAGNVMTSPDGVNWTEQTGIPVESWYGITYGSGLFVAVASSTLNGVMTSPDGINWTSRIIPISATWYGITYGNGLFVAVAASTTNNVMTSPDGINWTTQTSNVSNIMAVTYGNGKFVAVTSSGVNNRVITSPDGINWTTRVSDADNIWRAITYGNGIFVAISSDGTNDRVMTSPNGINWTTNDSGGLEHNWRGVTYGNGVFVAVSWEFANPKVIISTDGINWLSYTPADNNQWDSVIYGNGIFVSIASNIISNNVMTSGVKLENEIPKNNIYQGGMTINGQLILNDGTNQDGYFLTTDSSGNTSWNLVPSNTGITADITSLETELSGETIARISGDTSLSTAISTVSGDTLDITTILSDGEVLGLSGGELTGFTYTNDIESLSTSISGETDLRVSGDLSLTTALDNFSGVTEQTAGSGLTYLAGNQTLNVNVDDYTIKIVNGELRTPETWVEQDKTTTIVSGSGATNIVLDYEPVGYVAAFINGIEYLVSPLNGSGSTDQPFFFIGAFPVQGSTLYFDADVVGFGLETGVDLIVVKYSYINES